jgi:hypothetical protein
VGKIKWNKPYQTLNVTRWSQTVGDAYFYIDSIRSQINKEQGINDWYVSCGCKARDWSAIEGCFQELNIQQDSMIFPTPSAVIEHIEHSLHDLYDKLDVIVITDYTLDVPQKC